MTIIEVDNITAAQPWTLDDTRNRCTAITPLCVGDGVRWLVLATGSCAHRVVRDPGNLRFPNLDARTGFSERALRLLNEHCAMVSRGAEFCDPERVALEREIEACGHDDLCRDIVIVTDDVREFARQRAEHQRREREMKGGAT